MKVKNLGEYKLRDGRGETYFIGVLDTFINVSKDRVDFEGYDEIGKIKVYHNGLYFGTPEQMENWISDMVINHLIENEKIVVDGETISGEKLWKWKGE